MNKGDERVAILCVMLGIACYYDYRKGRIPNWLVLVIMIVGCVNQFLTGGSTSGIQFFLKICGVIILLLPVYRIGALGSGDVKLYGVCAGYLPSEKFLFFLFFSLLIAAILSLIKMVREKNTIDRMIYFFEYVEEVIRSGEWYLYIENERERRSVSICLAGPILASFLLHLGGVY